MIPLLAFTYAPPGKFLESAPHEHAAGANVYSYKVAGGQVLVTVWRGLVHELIFQLPCKLQVDTDRRNHDLFEMYGEGKAWNEILDNGSGKVYRRADLQRFALWSYAMDFNTFGTMAFHEVRWR